MFFVFSYYECFECRVRVSVFGFGSGLILLGSGYSPLGFGFSGTRLHQAPLNFRITKLKKIYIQGITLNIGHPDPNHQNPTAVPAFRYTYNIINK